MIPLNDFGNQKWLLECKESETHFRGLVERPLGEGESYWAVSRDKNDKIWAFDFGFFCILAHISGIKEGQIWNISTKLLSFPLFLVVFSLAHCQRQFGVLSEVVSESGSVISWKPTISSANLKNELLVMFSSRLPGDLWPVGLLRSEKVNFSRGQGRGDSWGSVILCMGSLQVKKCILYVKSYL